MSTMCASFDGKVAIVTGSTRGIGLATIRLLARCGAAVVVSSRKREACDVITAELVADGARAIAVPAHVGRDDDCRHLVESTRRSLGRIDILIVNAAINPVFEDASNLSDDVWYRTLEVNLAGAWRLSRLALPEIASQGEGSVVFVSSINARLGVPRSGAYGVSKAAVEQLTRQLAVEWGGKNVRVNAVAPGTIRTDMTRRLTADAEFMNALESRTPLRRIGEAADVAAAIVFLASAAARHITGQVLTVDGGETICRGAH